MLKTNSKTAVILLIEDDPADQELTRRALVGDVVQSELHIVSDGEEALEYLTHTGRFADNKQEAPLPDLILLDLNMPKMSGREVLAKIKEHERLRIIPVVILTTSQQETDIVRSYNLGCSSYITKPVEVSSFIEIIRELGSYWFQLVTLPVIKELDKR